MLLQLKNQELQEEKAKNAELNRHIEILKKRVYSKIEFEGQSKLIKEASEMIEKLKVFTKMKKEYKEINKQIIAISKKLRNKESKSNSKGDQIKTRNAKSIFDNDENS
jgi:hypothetical protein